MTTSEYKYNITSGIQFVSAVKQWQQKWWKYFLW